MTFSSLYFILLFLPVTLLGFQLAGRFGRRPAIGWLVLMSLVFYAQWAPVLVLILLASILANFCFSRVLAATASKPRTQHWVLVAGITFDLGLLCFYKYLFPLLEFLHVHGVVQRSWGAIALPLGISFFTFTQIAYLVDLKQGQAEPQSLLSYALFVTFFPHLIAGPILHHKEIMPQFAEERRYRLDASDVALGLSWFIIGLFKKTMVADRIAADANSLYAAPAGAGAWATWYGVLIYLMQLYFDFSGYSDMAVGLARMFSVRFPFNFNSPYKASGVIDYWQRWHMTLTRFLTLYIYNPISLAIGRRRAAKGKRISRKALATPEGFLSMLFFPVMVTMFLAGIWHGAGIQFLIFGVLHGLYLCVNHAWRTFVPAKSFLNKLLPYPVCVVVTLLCVILADVFFRGSSLENCFTVLAGMTGGHGAGQVWSTSNAWTLVVLFAWVWLLPNAQQLFRQEHPGDEKTWSLLPSLSWRPDFAWGAAMAAAFLLCLIYAGAGSTFLYFQF